MVRLGVLVHAETVAPESWSPLLRHLTERGEVVVVHAYADWSAPAMAGWLPALQRHGIQLRHQFRSRPSQDPALVAIAVDAVELIATARLDAIVLVGDLSSAVPLLQRLSERGVEVILAGPPATPLDVRTAAGDFLDLRTVLDDADPDSAGRHRA